MAKKTNKPTLKIELTPEQQQHIKRATGMDVASLDLVPEELEERIAPGLKDTLKTQV